MRRHSFHPFLSTAFAVLAFTAPASAQNPVIEEIRFSVQDMKTKEIIDEIPANGDLVLKVGDHVRLRTIAVPVGSNRKRRYPATSFELGNPAGLVSMTKMNAELGSATIQVHRASNRNRPDAVPFLRFKITEPLKIASRKLSGNIYIRLKQVEKPAPAPTAPPRTNSPEVRKGVTLYEDKYYAGRSEKFLEDTRNLANHYLHQDMATSVRVDPGCRVILFEHPDYQGRSQVLTESVNNLAGSQVANDAVSSLRVDCSDRWRQESRRYDDRRRDNRQDRRYDDRQDRGYPGREGVTLFEHPDYGGRSETFYGDDPQLSDNRIRQDTVSSVRVDPGCQAVLYEHPNYDGRASVLTEDLAYLSNTRVGNDRASSIEVRCDSSRSDDRRGYRTSRDDRHRRDDRRRSDRGVTLYQHEDFRGRAETFFGDDDRLNDNEIRQDEASSIQVDPGCEAVLYEHPDFQGRATVVNDDIRNLQETRVGNDTVSSIEVICHRRRY